MGALTGKVAVVTDASRTVGKGIALAEQGASVYVTGPGVEPQSASLRGARFADPGSARIDLGRESA